MNSFIENVNYLAGLDNKYGDRCEFLKTNLSLRNVQNNITFKASYFVYETMSIQSVEYSMSGAIYSDLNAIFTEFKNVVDATGYFTSDFTLSDNNNGFLVHSIAFNINSINTKVKLSDIEFTATQTVGGLQIYHLHGNVINSLKILPTLALFDQSILDGVIAVGQYPDEVVTVSNNIGSVAVVSTNIANINNVGNSIANVNTVGVNISNVNTTATDITNVNSVAGSITNVNTVSTNITDVNTVSDNISNVNSTGSNISNVNIVSTSIANVNAVGTNILDVNTVSTNIIDVVAVGDNIGNVVTVSGSVNNINTIAPSIANVDLVGPDISSVVIVANNIGAVVTDANNIGNINIVANDLSLSGYSNLLDAGSIVDSVISDPVGISVIETVAENIVNVNNTGSSITNVNTVGNNITNVNLVATQIVPNLAEILLADDNAATATIKAAEALASENKAHKWADELENVPVVGTIGLDDEYSAYHWAKKAEAAAGGSITLDSLYDVDATGVLDGGILRYDTTTSTWVDYDFNNNPILGLDKTYAGLTLEGQITWNSTEGTANLGLPSGSTLQIGQENIRTIRNSTAITIENGTLCMFDGTIGNSGRIKVKPFTAGFNEAMYLYGVATQDIISGTDGIITIEGKVRGIDTTGASVGEVWADEDILYAKPNDNGMMTNVMPADNELKLVVATVIHAHSTNGILEIRFTPMNENAIYNLYSNAGDILVGTGEHSASILQKGLPTQVLRVKADGSGLEFSSPSAATIGTDTTLYLDATSAFSDNLSLSGIPSIYSEQTSTSTISSGSVGFLERFVSAPLGVNTIPAGTWTFNTYASVDSSVGISNIIIRVNRRIDKHGMTATFTGSGLTRTLTVTGGNPFYPSDATSSVLTATLIETPTQTAWINSYISSNQVVVTVTDIGYVNETNVSFSGLYYLVLSDTSSELAVGVDFYQNTTVFGEIIVDPEDRLVVAYFCQTSSVNRIITLYYGGESRYSNIIIPSLLDVYTKAETDGLIDGLVPLSGDFILDLGGL